jgi:IS30 family transposase
VERLSAKERERIAELLAEGAPFWALCQEVHRSRHAIRRAVKSLLRPPPRVATRSPLRLSLVEREEISRGLVEGLSLREIARRLGRSPSTVSREVAANGGRRTYRACRADRGALRRACRPRVSKLASCPRLRAVVESKLELRWSPEQISGWLEREFPDEPEMRVSHETIYQSLFVQSRGALRKELTRYLRTHDRLGGRPRIPSISATVRARSDPRCTSVNDPRKLRIVRSLTTGKATSSTGKASGLSPRSSSVTAGS